MATLPIDIPDAVVPRVATAIVARYGSQGYPNTNAGRLALVKATVTTFLKGTVKEVESQQAGEAARRAAEAAAEAEIVLS